MSGIWNIRTFMKPRQVRPFRYVSRYEKDDIKNKPINLREDDFYSVHTPIARRLREQISAAQQRRYRMPLMGWMIILMVAIGWAWTEGWISADLIVIVSGLLIVWLWLRKKTRPNTR